MNYYNEWDKSAAAWLRELIRQGLIPSGDVDERSITEIKPHELAKYTQCHFFAGIGGWSVALRLAGWPSDRPVGTGSAPCQPFSAAGKQLGNADDRHLWPAFFKLIRECRALGQRWTDAIFGEQVESAIAHGWLDSLSTDMEGEGYAVGSAILGAHSVGAPQRRQRLYWVAYDQSERFDRGSGMLGENRWRIVEAGGAVDTLADAEHPERREEYFYRENGCDGKNGGRQETYGELGARGEICALEHPAGDGREQRRPESGEWGAVGGCSNGVALGNADLPRSQGWGLQLGGEPNLFETWTRGVDLIACTDGRKRLVKSGIFPLAYGFPSRVGLLRGSGNAIVPQVAAVFIEEAEAARHAGSRVVVSPAVETMDFSE